MPVYCRTSSSSSVAGNTAGTGMAGTVLVGIGAAMHFAAAWVGAVRGVGAAGPFRFGDRMSVPAAPVDGLPPSAPVVPVDGLPEFVPVVPVDRLPESVPVVPLAVGLVAVE